MSYTLGVIGGGNMGQAILRGAVSRGVLDADRIIVAEIDDARREAVAAIGCRVTDDPRETLDSEQLMLAVKPQGFAAVADAVGRLTRDTVVISIMAGLQSVRLRERLGAYARIVRVMPNTPCQIGLGMSSIALGEGAAPGDDDLSRRVFGAIGKVVTVPEAHMYAATAVAGSGPAYVFRLAEVMEAAALEVGLDADAARTLVIQTIHGAGALLDQSNETPAALRVAVTSPGGTTAAALDVMNRRDIAGMMAEAVAAARDRGVELDR